MWGVPEVLDQLCRDLIHSIIIVVHPDFHQVFPVCDVPLGPKLRYRPAHEQSRNPGPQLYIGTIQYSVFIGNRIQFVTGSFLAGTVYTD